jgi:hypothetical protein
MRRFALIAAALAATAISLPATAGDVSGKVYDQRGAPAAGVTLELGGSQVVTGADGSYSFTGVAAGEHMLSAGGQRVAVSVADEGETRRNLFLLSSAARQVVSGAPIDREALEATLALGETMLRDSQRRSAIAWRWNDLEG